MKIDYRDGLLFTSITLVHGGHRILIPDVVLDTGAVHSLISIDAVDEWFQRYEPDDQLIFMHGLGGSEAAVRRRVESVQFDTFSAQPFDMDFASLREHPGINGLIGLDILIPGQFVIDLKHFEVHARYRGIGERSQ
ncbi:hypothetical protein GCM10010885_16880 [Alicyclobacillus cellulosilyticus]|uniref:Aspartyl protease n=1 Tax=Alicyclobacillus cellulosilyticus TaxID=1003997 RepID=A0A917NM74_9BACL|nr:retropepsin-like aspartic protease [Alicyclobacillus cellulosilyticus]GGJ08396.1 hypothetical protein GCM10010885_16880 [Alicyclobacillus cellulosilyticus]